MGRMRRRFGNRGWPFFDTTMRIKQLVAGLLIVAIVLGCGGAPALAEYARVLSPESNTTLSGAVEVSAGFEADARTPVTRVTMSVDGSPYAVKGLTSPQQSGVVSLLWDTTAFSDGAHGISLYFYSGSKLVGKCYQKLQVSNGRETAANPPGKGPALIQMKNLRDGEKVSGRRQVAVLPASSLGQGVFLSVHVDSSLKLISNRAPFEFTLDSTALSDGPHVVEAQVRDSAQNLLAARTVRVTVENAGTVASAVRQAELTPAATSGPTARIERPRASTPTPPPPSANRPGPAIGEMARAPEPVPSNVPARVTTVPALRPAEPTAKSESGATAVARPDVETAPSPSEPQPPVAEATADVPETASDLPNESARAAAPEFSPAPASARAAAQDASAQPSVPVEVPKPVAPSASPALVPPAVKPETKWQGDLARAIEEPRLSRPPLIIPPADRPRATGKVEQVKPLPPKTQVEPNASTAGLKLPDGMVMAALPPAVPAPAPDGLIARPAPAAEPEPVLAPPVSSAAQIAPDVKPATTEVHLSPRAVAGDPVARPAVPAPTAPAPAAVSKAPQPVRVALGPRPKVEEHPRSTGATSVAAPRTSTVTYTERNAPVVRGASLVTLRKAMESFGASVSWDHYGKTATVRTGSYKLVVDARAGTAKVNGRQMRNPQVRIANGHIQISAKALARGLKLDLSADPKSRQIRLTLANQNLNG